MKSRQSLPLSARYQSTTQPNHVQISNSSPAPLPAGSIFAVAKAECARRDAQLGFRLTGLTVALTTVHSLHPSHWSAAERSWYLLSLFSFSFA